MKTPVLLVSAPLLACSERYECFTCDPIEARIRKTLKERSIRPGFGRTSLVFPLGEILCPALAQDLETRVESNVDPIDI